MAVGDLLRYLFLAILACVGLVIGMKVWGKQKAEKRVVRELRVLLKPTAQFEQLYARDAQEDLFRSMASIHEGVSRLDKEPGEILNKVFHGKGKGALFENPDPGQDRYYTDPRETLIRESLLRNYQRCNNLGIFQESENLRRLMEGEAPEIRSGPSSGRDATIGHIIAPALSPGIEKLIPNMIIGEPKARTPTGRPSDLELKQAKSLTHLLYRANLIEQDAEERLLKHYDAVAEGRKPALAPATP